MHALSGGLLSNSFNTTGIEGGVGGEQTVVMISMDPTAPPAGMVASGAHHNEFLNPEPFVNYYRSNRDVFLPKEQFHPPGNMVSHLGKVQSALKKVRDVVLSKQALDGKAPPPGATAPSEPLTVRDNGESDEAEMMGLDNEAGHHTREFLNQLGLALKNKAPADGMSAAPSKEIPVVRPHRHPKPVRRTDQRCVDIPSAVVAARVKCTPPTVPASVMVCSSGKKRGRATIEHVVSYPTEGMTSKDRHKRARSRRTRPEKDTTVENTREGEIEEQFLRRSDDRGLKQMNLRVFFGGSCE